MTRIILATLNAALRDAWTKSCGDIAGVEIHSGSVFDVACDALVSPANSFGFMDGGIDAQYTDYFGSVVQYRLRLRILQRHHGELLVGAAELIETDNPNHPFLVAAPHHARAYDAAREQREPVSRNTRGAAAHP
jgi:O-acetyl-ADP-ribose deacetylase (regulator of RNase III)